MTGQAQMQMDQNGRCRKSNKRIETRTHNNRFGNRLADGRTIGYKSISAIVTAWHYLIAFSYYLHLW